MKRSSTAAELQTVDNKTVRMAIDTPPSPHARQHTKSSWREIRSSEEIKIMLDSLTARLERYGMEKKGQRYRSARAESNTAN